MRWSLPFGWRWRWCPFLWFTRARKPMLFCFIAFAVGWLQMAITKNAGLSAHHITLLWPLPQWFLAVALAEAAAWRPLGWRNAGDHAAGERGSVPGG